MKFIPDLIPEEFRVLLDYFKEENNNRNNKKPNPFSVLLLILLFVITAILFGKAVVAFFYIGIGLLFTKFGKNWIEGRGTFILTTRIRTVLSSLLFLASVPTWFIFQGIENKAKAAKEFAHQKAVIFTADSLKKINFVKTVWHITFLW